MRCTFDHVGCPVKGGIEYSGLSDDVPVVSQQIMVEHLVGGLEPWIFMSQTNWEVHNPNWRTHSIIFQRVGQPPTRILLSLLSLTI